MRPPEWDACLTPHPTLPGVRCVGQVDHGRVHGARVAGVLETWPDVTWRVDLGLAVRLAEVVRRAATSRARTLPGDT